MIAALLAGAFLVSPLALLGSLAAQADSWDLLPNDTLFGSQWALDNTGQSGGAIGADINILDAWEVATGDTTVVVAIIGTGMDLEHPDLAPNLWINWAECCTNDGIDDDENGYVDDYYGWDFLHMDNDPSHEANDDICHATRMAGIVSAKTNNNLGIAGVAGGWGPGRSTGAKLMVLRVSRPGQLANEAVADAVRYAVDNGADIIVMGFGVSELPGFGGRSMSAADYAWNHGVLIVASGGNVGCENPDACAHFGLPKANEKVLAVGASNHDDGKPEPSDYSCCDYYINLVAPGGDLTDEAAMILSTTCSADIPQGYGYRPGSAYAASYVAGAAALALSADGSLTHAELWTLIESSADHVGPNDGWDSSCGWGRLNAGVMLRALAYAQNSYFTYEQASHKVFSPAGNAERFEIAVTVRDEWGAPLSGIPARAIWAESELPNRFKLCCADEETPGCVIDYSNRVYADGPTDAEGCTRITIMAAAGAGEMTPIRLRLYGLEIHGQGVLPLFPCHSYDIDGDCMVTSDDLELFSEWMGTENWRGDFDADGDVDQADSLLIVGHLGDECSMMAAQEDGSLDPAFPEVLIQTYPNPSTQGATIHYELPVEGAAVSIRIYDVSGRLVKNLIDSMQGAGRQDLVWDGTDETGRTVTPGVYFCRAELGEHSDMKCIILLK